MESSMLARGGGMGVRPSVRVAFLLCALHACLLWGPVPAAGCSAERVPSERPWEMTFTTSEGEVVVVTVSRHDLFRSKSALPTRRQFRTRAPCRSAWLDPSSRRMATLEEEDGNDVIQVYDQEGALLYEYRPDAAVVGRVSSCVCVNAGGDRLAFLTERGTVWICEIQSPLRDGSWQICLLVQGVKPYVHWRSCLWVEESTLVADCARTIFRIRTGKRDAHILGNGNLAGVVGRSVIAVNARSSKAFTLSDASTGERLGHARTRHTYSGFVGVSPCGEYVAYSEPRLMGHARFFVHHLPSGKRAQVQIPPRWKLGSWTGGREVQPAPARKKETGGTKGVGGKKGTKKGRASSSAFPGADPLWPSAGTQGRFQAQLGGYALLPPWASKGGSSYQGMP